MPLASFIDYSGNNALDAYETATLSLTVRNSGRGPAANLRATVLDRLPGVTITTPDPVLSLEPGRETTLPIQLRADGTLRDGTARLRVVVEEARGFNSDTLAVEFGTRAERPPQLAIARAGIDDDQSGESFGNGDGQFQTGESVEIVAIVENSGTGAAEDVTAEIATTDPQVYLLRPQDGKYSLGTIAPGATAELPIVLSVARIYRGPNQVPVTVRLRDQRERYRWDIPLPVSLNVRASSIQTVRIEATGVPETAVARVSRPAATTNDTTVSVAALDLDCPGLSRAEITTLSDRLRTSLHQTGAFDVMERGKMETILAEQSFNKSGCVDETTCAVEIGQLVAVRGMVAGSVGKVGTTYAVTLRLIDVGSARVTDTVTQDCEGCAIEQVLRQTLPQAASALAGEVQRRTANR